MNEIHQKTILLVEDEAIISMAEKLILEKYGYNVISAYSGQQAVEKARNIPGIDLILMDISLGDGIDGAEAARIILGERDIPLLFLSANAQAEVVGRTEIIESYGYVMKQMGESVLIAAIRAAFRLHDSYNQIRVLHDELVAVYEEMQEGVEELEITNQELLETQKGLMESEIRFSKAFRSSPAPLVISEIETGRFIDVNDAWSAMLGHTQEEQVGQTSSEIGIWADPDARELIMRNFREKGSFHDEPVKFTTRTGRTVEAFWSAETITLDGRDVMLSLIYDVTELKLASEAQKSSEEFLDNIVEQSPFPVVIYDITGRIVRINRAVRDQFSPPDDSILMGEYNVLRDRQLFDQGFMPLMESVFREGKTVRFTCLYDTRDPLSPDPGSPHCLELDSTVFPVKDTRGNITHVVTYHLDITDSSNARRELADTKAMLESAFSQNPVPMVLARSSDNVISIANRSILEFFGIDREDEYVGHPLASINKTWEDFDRNGQPVPFEDNPIFLALKGLTVKNREFETVTKDGSRKWGYISASPVYNDDGKLIAGFLSFPDITEIKRAEREKNALQNQLLQSQKMESIGILAGGVAHDFNNMLGVIIGHAEMLIAGYELPGPVSEGLNEILKAANRSADLTRQLLAFARRQTASPVAMDLNEKIEGMLKMLRRLIGEDVVLAWIPGRDPGSVRMDPSQVDQVLANLCVNARDALSGSGRITIETGAVTFDAGYCAGQPGSEPGDYILLTVSDNGCGMTRETMSRIFEPFFSTKPTGKGTGLGLSTVYGIVKQNNGLINVYSEPGYGTTFRIYLPRFIGEHGGMDAETVQEPEHGSETILIVEDELMILDVTSTMLGELGYTVVKSSSPEEALKLGSEYKGEIHLLMTDVVMPGMNGRDLAERLLSSHPGLRCLFMSGYTDDVIADHGVLDEGVSFIQKPFTMKEIASSVRKALAVGRGGA